MTTIPRPAPSALQDGVSNKVIIITGAAGGIGLAMANLFAVHGATVVLVDIAKGLETAAEGIQGKTVSYQCDVSSWDESVQLFEWVKAKYGRIDILFCNAGVCPEASTAGEEDDPECQSARKKVAHNLLAEEVDDNGLLMKPASTALNINLASAIYGLKLGLYHMADKPGNIIFTGSAASYLGVGGQDLYTVSKHAILGLLRATIARPDVQSQQVAISMLAPWYTKTQMTSGMAKSRTEHTLASEPEDVAWAAAYLLSVPQEQANGKAIWIQGKEFLEVEESYMQWLMHKINAGGLEWKE